MSEKWLNNPSEISKRIHASVAYRIYTMLLTLDINFFVFDKNYRDLKLAIDAFSQPEKIHLLFDQRESQIILYHVVRLVHNYLAAAKTLIDHTRMIINDWYKQTDFLDEYKEQIKTRFTNNELAGFIEDLRNYALHYSLPITGFRIQIIRNPETGEQSERITFFIEKKCLLEWSNWSKGKGYLQNTDTEIVIEQIVDEYYRQVIDFHGWMHKRLEEMHFTELQGLDRMDKRLKELLKPIYDHMEDRTSPTDELHSEYQNGKTKSA